MKGRLITDNMHNFCNLINAANILESPSVLLQLMCSLHPERGWVAYPGPGSAPLSLPNGTHGGNRVQIHVKTLPCHFLALEHPVWKCSSWEGDCCEWAEGNGARPQLPTRQGCREAISLLSPCPACAAAEGGRGTYNQGEFCPGKDQKPLRDGSRSSNPIHPCLELKPSKGALP